MSKVGKENRINSLAVRFLERQQIIPHSFAEGVINAYKEGYHQAEKDLELDWNDVAMLHSLLHEVEQEFKKGMYEDKTYRGYCQEILKRFKEKKAVMGYDFYYFNCPVCGCKVSANWIIK